MSPPPFTTQFHFPPMHGLQPLLTPKNKILHHFPVDRLTARSTRNKRHLSSYFPISHLCSHATGGEAVRGKPREWTLRLAVGPTSCEQGGSYSVRGR